MLERSKVARPWEWWLVAVVPMLLVSVQNWLFPRLATGWAWVLWGLSAWEGSLSLMGAIALVLLRRQAGELEGGWGTVSQGLADRGLARLVPFVIGSVLALWPMAPWGARVGGVLLAVLVVSAVLEDQAQRR